MFTMFNEVVTQDEMKFLRLLLKCDANISQEQKHLKTKLARKDFTDYVEDIAHLRQMLSSLEQDPKRNKTDKDLIEYRNRVEYLDTALTQLEVEAAPAPMSMIPPSIDGHAAPAAEGLSGGGGCIFKKAAAPAPVEPSGGCIFKKAAAPVEPAAEAQGGCIFKKASSGPSAGVCPITQKSTDEGACPSTQGKSAEDLFKMSEDLGGCPMFQATPEESEQMRKEAAAGIEEVKNAGKCPMTGSTSEGGGCPMAAPGEHPELEGTWMAPLTDDPNECPTFLPRPIVEAPKYSNVKKRIKADNGLVFLEDAEKEIQKTLDLTIEKLKKGEKLQDDVMEKVILKNQDKMKTDDSKVQIKEYEMFSIQSLFFAHIQKLWMVSAMVVLGVVIQKVIF